MARFSGVRFWPSRRCARAGPLQAGQDRQQRRLARSIGPEQPEHFAGPNFKAHAIQGHGLAVAMVNVRDFQKRVGHTLTSYVSQDN